MTLTAGTFVRSGIVILIAVVLQVSGFADMRILGGNIDLVPLIVGAMALYGGAITGAIAGFCTGVLVDLAIGQHLGVTALVLTALGYWVGRFGELRKPSHGLVPIPIGAAATAGYLVALAAVSFMLDVGASVSALVVRDAAVTILLNALFALPIFALLRWILRPVLAVDPYQRRRRRVQARSTSPVGLSGMEV